MSEMQYVLEKFYPYFWRKFKFPVEADTESKCDGFLKKLREAVWVHRILTLWHWSPFLEINLKPMVSSPKTYVSFIFFMISTTIKGLPTIQESFMTSCSLVTAVAAYVYDKGYYEFLEYCPAILTVLYEEKYSGTSETVPVWNHLPEHLINCNYSEAYTKVEEMTKGKPFSDVINTREFVMTIKVLIQSNISVSEHAEVYLHTMKVVNSFPSRTARKHSFFENRAMNLNAWFKPQVSLQNTEQRKRESLEGMAAKHIEPDGLNNSQSVPNVQNQRTDDLGSVSRSDGTEDKEESKRDQSLQSELTQNDERLRKFETKKGATETIAIYFDRISSYQSETRLEDSKMSENEKINKKTPQSPSEKKSHQENPPTISENGKSVLMLDDGKVVNLESISSSHPGRPPTPDVQKPKKPESKQSASTNGAIDSNRISSQSVEDFKTPGKSKSEQISCAKNEVVKSYSVEHLFQGKEKRSLKQHLKDTEVIHLKQFLSPQSELSLQDESKKKSEIEKSSAKVDTEAVDLPISSSYSEEQSMQNEKTPRVPIRQGSSMVEESEAIDLKGNLPFQTKQPLREDFEKPRMPENEQTFSVAKETGDIHLQQISSFQSKEQSVQSDVNKLGILDSEQNTPVGSSLNDLNSKDDNSRIKTEYPTNVLDEPRDTKTTGQSTASRTSKKHKHKKTKSSLQDEKKPKISNANQSSTKVQDTEVVNLSISSSCSETSLQTMEKSSDAETSLPVPSKKEALHALSFLIKKLNDNFLTVQGLLNNL